MASGIIWVIVRVKIVVELLCRPLGPIIPIDGSVFAELTQELIEAVPQVVRFLVALQAIDKGNRLRDNAKMPLVSIHDP